MSEPRPNPRSRVSTIVLIATAAVAIAAGALAYAHQGMGHGGMMSAQGIEMHLDHVQAMLGRIGASEAQKAQINETLKNAFGDMRALHEKHSQVLTQFHELLLAPNLDRARIEALRAEQIKAMDEASKRLVDAIDGAAEVLSADQRVALAEEIRKHHDH